MHSIDIATISCRENYLLFTDQIICPLKQSSVWSSGYDDCLTHSRSRVRSSVLTYYTYIGERRAFIHLEPILKVDISTVSNLSFSTLVVFRHKSLIYSLPILFFSRIP